MTASATRKLTGIKYAATILGAFAVLAVAPATAFATDNEPTPGGGGCHYTDADGYDIPIDEGQDVFVDGKIVSCRGGSIVVTTAPQRANEGRAPVVKGGDAPVVKGGNLPVFKGGNLGILTTQR
jgi:hypothetical protein